MLRYRPLSPYFANPNCPVCHGSGNIKLANDDPSFCEACLADEKTKKGRRNRTQDRLEREGNEAYAKRRGKEENLRSKIRLSTQKAVSVYRDMGNETD